MFRKAVCQLIPTKINVFTELISRYMSRFVVVNLLKCNYMLRSKCDITDGYLSSSRTHNNVQFVRRKRALLHSVRPRKRWRNSKNLSAKPPLKQKRTHFAPQFKSKIITPIFSANTYKIRKFFSFRRVENFAT